MKKNLSNCTRQIKKVDGWSSVTVIAKVGGSSEAPRECVDIQLNEVKKKRL